VLAAVRGLGPDLLDDPSGLSLVADALYELTDALLGMAAAGKLSDETLRALAGLDGVTARLAAALRRERQAAAGDRPQPPVRARGRPTGH
jgi:hypothetical protein